MNFAIVFSLVIVAICFLVSSVANYRPNPNKFLKQMNVSSMNHSIKSPNGMYNYSQMANYEISRAKRDMEYEYDVYKLKQKQRNLIATFIFVGLLLFLMLVNAFFI